MRAAAALVCAGGWLLLSTGPGAAETPAIPEPPQAVYKDRCDEQVPKCDWERFDPRVPLAGRNT